MAYALTGARIFDGVKFLDGMAVVVDGKQIATINSSATLPSSIKRIDLKGGLLAPGFIDVQVNGGGGALLRAFCERSDGDVESHGTYLETANHGNVAFYEHCGFKLSGEAALDSATQLYCLFRPKAGPAA